MYRHFLEMEFNELRHYSALLERLFLDEARRLAQDVDKKAAEMSQEQRTDFLQWTSDDFYYLGQSFPQILRSSLFLHAYSLFENGLLQLADYHRDAFGLGVSPSDLKDKGITRAKTYLNKVALVPFPNEHPTWKQIKTLSRIRNLVVHKNGYLPENDNDRAEIDAFMKTWSEDIYLNDLRHLEFSPHFIARVVNTFTDFLTELFRNLKEP